MASITLFTTPKPFTDPHIDVIQRNALRNWLALGDAIEVVVIGDEAGVSDVCEELDIIHLPDVECNEMGTPLISSIFQLARDVNDTPLLMYSNADILFLPNLVEIAYRLADRFDHFLGIGQRWDWNIDKNLGFNPGWEVNLSQRVYQEGKLHLRAGSDFFIYPRGCFQNIPDFAVGRAGWDNWMIYQARWEHCPVIDLSGALTVVHQNHDYSHLAGGIRHYFQPETAENVKLAGGRHTIFTLDDATHIIKGAKIMYKPIKGKTLWHEIEIFPLVRLHSRFLWRVTSAIVHPIKTFARLKGWITKKIKRSEVNE